MERMLFPFGVDSAELFQKITVLQGGGEYFHHSRITESLMTGEFFSNSAERGQGGFAFLHSRKYIFRVGQRGSVLADYCSL
jgi:hypothetical protein